VTTVPNDSPVVIPLADGGRLVLSAEQLSLGDRPGTTTRAIRWDDISNIHRGGRDIVITRRNADPVVVTAASLADAQRCLEALAQRHSSASSTRWWNRRQRPD
jgi:hypothetical protein